MATIPECDKESKIGEENRSTEQSADRPGRRSRSQVARAVKCSLGDEFPRTVASAITSGLMVYTATTMLFVGTTLILPFFFDEFGDDILLYIEYFYLFVYFQTLMNWYQAKKYSSKFTKKVSKEFMDECDEIEATVYHEEEEKQVTVHEGPWAGGDTDPILCRSLRRERQTLLWKWCKLCNNYCPPRAHHCMLCDGCILKRDHHCFFLNTCVGFNNQRFFALTCFYVSLASITGLLLELLFIYLILWSIMDWYQFFLPCTIYEWFTGEMPIEIVFVISHLYLLPLSGFISTSILLFEIDSITTGKTEYEETKNLNLRNSNSFLTNIKSVFGKYWYLSLIFPCDFAYKQFGDPTYWPNMKIKKRLGKRRRILKEAKDKHV